MIPIYFDKTETDFTSNGIGRLTDCISCKVTEERNGIYELELEYPITGQWYDEMMADGGIIGVIHDDNHDIQPFDIYMSTAPIDGIVTFFAHHISYRLNNIMLQPFTASDAASAIAGIVPNSVNANPFTFSTDKTTQAVFNLKKPASVRSILFGSEGSLLDTFGTAEFKFDKFNVEMLLHRGTDTGVTVRYGKNMTDLERTKDDSNTYNALAPFWSDGVNYVYPDSIIVQPTTPITPVKPISMDFSDKFEQQPTKAELETAARNFLDANEPWLISDNIKVNFIALWQTEEYADVASIQRVGLCDTVSVYYTDMGIVAEKKKVVRVVFDVLTERFEELELGTVSNAYVAITDGTNQTSNVPVDQALNGKVSKTGDTMTGDLAFVDNKRATFKGNLAVGDLPPSTAFPNELQWQDSNGAMYGTVRGRFGTDGKVGLQIGSTRGGVNNFLQLNITENGDRNVAVSETAPWLSGLGAVAKAGDEMSGGLRIKTDGTSSDNGLVVQDTDYGLNNLPSATVNKYLFTFKEKAATILGYIRGYINQNGRTGISIAGRNVVNGSGVLNALNLTVNADGTRLVTVTEVAPWLSALGLGTSGALPLTIAQGGTGKTTAADALEALNGAAQVVAVAGNAATASYNTVITFATAVRAVVVVMSSTAASRALFLVWCASATSNPSVTEIYKGANITYTVAAGKLTIKTSSGTAYSDVIPLNTKSMANVTLSRVAK